MLRLLVTGSRAWTDAASIRRVLDERLSAHGAMVLYHGHHPAGADAVADRWALEALDSGAVVVLHRFTAEWGRYGRRAGPIRNAEMVRAFRAAALDVDVAEVHGFLRGASPGTTGCLELAERAGFEPVVHRWEEVTGGEHLRLDVGR